MRLIHSYPTLQRLISWPYSFMGCLITGPYIMNPCLEQPGTSEAIWLGFCGNSHSNASWPACAHGQEGGKLPYRESELLVCPAYAILSKYPREAFTVLLRHAKDQTWDLLQATYGLCHGFPGLSLYTEVVILYGLRCLAIKTN